VFEVAMDRNYSEAQRSLLCLALSDVIALNAYRDEEGTGTRVASTLKEMIARVGLYEGLG
jgi:hypothetical protein